MPPGSFGIFETFRILIPGYFAALFADWYFTLFWPSTTEYIAKSNLATATFFGFGLLAGFLLYQSKLPSDPPKVKELLPSKAILDRAAQLNHPMESGAATNLYFYLLNSYIPDSLRERIYFYGNIYRVAQKMWLLAAFFSITAAISLLARCILNHAAPSMISGGSYLVTLLLIAMLSKRSAASRYSEILLGQRYWLQMRRGLVDSLIQRGEDTFKEPNTK